MTDTMQSDKPATPLKRILDGRRISQRELSRATRIDISTISDLCAGGRPRVNPRLYTTAYPIARYLGLSIYEIFPPPDPDEAGRQSA